MQLCNEEAGLDVGDLVLGSALVARSRLSHRFRCLQVVTAASSLQGVLERDVARSLREDKRGPEEQ